MHLIGVSLPGSIKWQIKPSCLIVRPKDLTTSGHCFWSIVNNLIINDYAAYRAEHNPYNPFGYQRTSCTCDDCDIFSFSAL